MSMIIVFKYINSQEKGNKPITTYIKFQQKSSGFMWGTNNHDRFHETLYETVKVYSIIKK